MTKIFFLFTTLLLITGCSQNKEGLKVAASSVPHAQLLEFVRPELADQGFDLDIIVTDDYNMPNRSLSNGEIDANFFQHSPFMNEQKKQFDYSITSLAKIEIEPMGVYSKKIDSLAYLKERSTIAIPNDPTNEARALLLMESQGLIQLQNSTNLQSTVLNIAKNPKQLKFVEVDAAMLPRTLDDVDAAVINTNYALEAGLMPSKDALVLESQNSPYANIIAIREGDEERPELKALKTAMTSEKIREFILKTYKGEVLPAF